MPLGLIEVSFDPTLYVGDLGIRWQTIGITFALLVALGLAAAIASYLPPRTAQLAGPPGSPFPEAPAVTLDPATDRLRLDDLAYIVLGIVPGAVVGGRLVHGIVYWDAYAADPGRLLDPGLGSLSLLGAVLGGTISAAYVASLLDAPIRRWADAATVPLLVALGLGKVAQFLGGSGQGAAFDGAWAVALLGDGPWHSLNPEMAAHPAQLYEALWMLLGIALALRLAGPGRDLARILGPRLREFAGQPRAEGLVFASAIAWFLLGRVLIGFTWRDEPVVGPFNAEQSVALAILVGVVVGFAVKGARGEPARVDAGPT
ncbi:MAG TPA: prolipoprotein diacylglyceryl transferase family protein [Candidatus Limnocylindrales bacterium]|jgi:prolipoprotein diacylglyceryltransferase|nr:prolipoprotein diacylglyceryl transferase family protein [Candidatus Limnocylindrales bacterium]